MEAKQNDKQAKTHEHPYTRMNNHEHPWTPMSTRARMSTHELTWTRVFPNTMQLANYLLNHLSHSFWVLILGCWLCEFLIWLFFLELNIISIFMFYVFLFCPVVASCPKKILADFCKTWFLINIYVYSHSFIYSNIYIYIYICNVMYFYIQYNKYIYIYIYVCCVCGGGLPQNEVSFFPLKEPFLEPKKDRHIHVYTIYIYVYILTGVFFYPVLVCPIQNICFLVFFRM